MKIKWSEKVSNAEIRRRCFQENIMVEITRRKWRFIGHILRKDSTSISRKRLFWPPWQGAKEDAPGLHGVEHQKRSWKIWGCPGQSSGRRRRIDSAGEQSLRPYVPDGTTRTDDDDEESLNLAKYISENNCHLISLSTTTRRGLTCIILSCIFQMLV